MYALSLLQWRQRVTNAFTGVTSSSGASIRSLVFQSCNPEGAHFKACYMNLEPSEE
jgi:hypothetical protein